MTPLRLSLSVLAIAAFAGAAHAQGTPQQRAACRSDVVRFCKGIENPDAIHSCLQSNYSKISARCKTVLSGG